MPHAVSEDNALATGTSSSDTCTYPAAQAQHASIKVTVACVHSIFTHTQVMPHAANKDNELMKGTGSAGSRTPGSTGTPTRLPPFPDAANISLAAAAGNPHAAAAVAAAASAAGSNKGSNGLSKEKDTIRTLPPAPPSRAAAAAAAAAANSSGGHTNGSSNSRASGGGSDKPSGGSSAVGTPQLQLVQRLPSLTGGTPRLVHKVETWLVQVSGVYLAGNT
jgi:hypothetical protein